MNDETKRDLPKRTKDFALLIIQMVSSLPSTDAARIMGRQILRSGTSVGANYREANRARSKAEFISKIGDSLKELDGTSYWLELLAESNTATSSKLSEIKNERDQLLAIFTTISKRTKSTLQHS